MQMWACRATLESHFAKEVLGLTACVRVSMKGVSAVRTYGTFSRMMQGSLLIHAVVAVLEW